ncbi:reverse transcriptase domain-containing protein [Tanacetum coccineum]|uniref:Reverse transcriptase domain-containing protein n=1 Tax=Tanacetum coccineum TaxID=301880 RepID=A0ABQ5FZY8_9ASTR
MVQITISLTCMNANKLSDVCCRASRILSSNEISNDLIITVQNSTIPTTTVMKCQVHKWGRSKSWSSADKTGYLTTRGWKITALSQHQTVTMVGGLARFHMNVSNLCQLERHVILRFELETWKEILVNYLITVQDSIYEQDVDLEEDREENGDDGDIFDMWDITVVNVERVRQFLTPNVPNVMDNIIQPLILKTIHTTPLDEDYVAPATKSILDDLLEEFKDEILNVTMVDKGAECSLTMDLKELERLLAKDPQSHYTEIQVHSVIINLEPFVYTQLMSPLYGVFKTSKPCKVDRDIISPGRYDFYLSLPYPIAYLHPNDVYCYFHSHLIPSEGMDTILPSK